MKSFIIISTALLSLLVVHACGGEKSLHLAAGGEGASRSSGGGLFEDLELPLLGGGSLSGAELRGQVVLVVNVASACGFTRQYEGLQALYTTYKARAFSVLGVPCNQFGNQESGSPEEIRHFVSSTYGVTFPLLAKQEVKGSRQSLLFQRLLGASADKDDVSWNFEKILVGRDGRVIERFNSLTGPEDEELAEAIEKALQVAASSEGEKPRLPASL